MRLVFAPLALADLEEIGDFIALDNPPRALSYGQYLIFYRPMGSIVRVERILHGARDVGAQFVSE